MSSRPPRLAYDLEHDVRALAAMASSLTPYLYEKETFGYLEGDLPRLTLGGLLLRLYRLSRLESLLNAAQQSLVQQARATAQAECARWAVHYENKLRHELRARLDALDIFLNECLDDRRNCAANYPSQAEKRTMIEHLRAEAQQLDLLTDELEARIKGVDQKLRHLLHEGEFISDECLQSVYPRDQFWWLYGEIPETNH